jgi:tetratricopeptide (TPR) repeat protein
MTGRIISIMVFLLIGACAHTPPESRTPLLTYEEHIELAAIYEKRGETDRALMEYEKASRVGGNNPYPYFAMGNIYLGRWLYIDAEDSYIKAIELDPDVGIFYNNLGWLYLETNRPIMADSVVRQGLVMDPGRSYIYLDTLGVIATRLGNFEEAEGLLNEAAVIIPAIDTLGLFHIYNHLVELYLITGDDEKADEMESKIDELRSFDPMLPYAPPR